MTLRPIFFLLTLLLGVASLARAADKETVITFERATIGKPVPTWTEQGVVFKLVSPPVNSLAVGRVTFFPHLGTGKNGPDKIGIVNAMAEEQDIPVQATLPAEATSVTVVFWASTACPALLQAFDKDGKLVDQASVPAAPVRKSPEEIVPNFELKVKGPAISFITFSGPRRGEYLAAERLRFTPLPSTVGTTK